MSLTSLTTPEISTLTHLLQHLPTETASTHTQRIASLIRNLPSRSPLKRVSRLSSLLPQSSSPHNLSPQLCKLHRPLSGLLITTLFHALALEVGPHLNTLTLHATSLTPAEQSRITSLRELHSLWLPPDIYRSTFLAPPNDKQWPYLPAQCPACTLSRIAGDMPTLLSLRMVLSSRTSSRTSNHKPHTHTCSTPRLTPYITHWIAHLSTHLSLSSAEFETLVSTNDADAAALKTTRKELWRKRRESRRVWRASQLEQKRRRSHRRRTLGRGGSGDMISQGRGVEAGSSPDPSAEAGTKAEAKSEQPSIRVSDASSNNNTQHTSLPLPVEDTTSSFSSTDSDPSDAENNHFLDPTSPAYLSTISIASTVSFHERPRTYIFPVTLTTHENVDIAGGGETRKRKQKVPIRPPPTDFGKLLAPAGQADDSKLKSLRPTLPIDIQSNTLPSPSLYSPTSPSTIPTEQDRDRDSYLAPVFPHHAAYLPPSAADRAKRYQNLLSPNPLLRESEEELRINPPPPRTGRERDSLRDRGKALPIPETPGLPRRSSRWISSPIAYHKAPDSHAGSSISSQSPRRSHSTRSQPSSRISSITSMSANSAYSSSLKPAPLSVRSSGDGEESSDGKERVVSTFTIKDGGAALETEGDWYAQPRDVDLRRSRTAREVSASGLSSKWKAEARCRARRELEGRNGRGSVATDTTRWSDVYTCFVEDAKR